MAAAQVFAIPELLESIITQVALDAVATFGRTSLQPITALACLHRVDRTFNATMKGSKLQRAMFSDSDGLSYGILSSRIRREEKKPVIFDNIATFIFDTAAITKRQQILRETTQFSPLDWLWGLVGHEELNEEICRTAIVVQTMSNDYDDAPAKLKAILASKAGSRMASWRQVKVNQSDVAKERLFRAVVYFKPPDGYDGWMPYTEDFAFDDGTTLGDIFDRYVEIVGRKISHHAELGVAMGD